MAEDAFRITTIETQKLCKQLLCSEDADDIDNALSDAEYVRLDHGLPPGQKVAILSFLPKAGKDPGHRGPAISFAMSLLHVIHADGRPSQDRVRKTLELSMETVETDAVGEKIIAALGAYCAQIDPGYRALETVGPFAISPGAMARTVYEISRHSNIVTDVCLLRAISIGEKIEGWEKILLSNMKADEPIVKVRKHDSQYLEDRGLEPALAEMLAWLRVHPEAGLRDFEKLSEYAGYEPREAGLKIAEAIGAMTLLEDRSV
jgi:hypothetical protein